MDKTNATRLVALFVGNCLLLGASFLALNSIFDLSLGLQEILGTSLLAGALITGYNIFLLRMRSKNR